MSQYQHQRRKKLQHQLLQKQHQHLLPQVFQLILLNTVPRVRWVTEKNVDKFCIYYTDPCKTEGCSAPYNIGCRVVDNQAQCICPTCRFIRRPVCASDGVQDLTECYLKQQACQAEMNVTVAKQGSCGMYLIRFTHRKLFVKG